MLRSTSLALRAFIIDAPLSTSSNPSFAAFHSSSVVAATLKGRGRALSLSKGRRTPKGLSRTQYKSTSRTRLVKSLRPAKAEGVYEVAKRWVPDENGRQNGSIPASKDRSGSHLKVLKKPEPHVLAARKEASVEALLDEEFDRSTSQKMDDLPISFSHPRLLPGLSQSVTGILGQDAQPTPIQALSLKHLLPLSDAPDKWRQVLLASETGSGKSFAYLLPLLQHLKENEYSASSSSSKLPINPRALVLAPTHELSRQLSAFAKSLIHHAKLRVLCASRANVPNKSGARTGGGTARQMKYIVEALTSESGSQGGQIQLGAQMADSRQVDLLVSTPTKALEMVRGWGWDKPKEEAERDGKKFEPGKPEMGLERVECVVVDEADILFDPDFRQETLTLLSDISAARGHPLPPSSSSSPTRAIRYPFHLLLTSATIPASLSSYLSTHHPTLTRLASPNLHRLPATLHTEHVGWTGGARGADIEKRLRRVWAEDALRGPDQKTGRLRRSKVLIFANKRNSVAALGADLESRGVPNVALASGSAARAVGSNKHLAGFVNGVDALKSKSLEDNKDKKTKGKGKGFPEEPHVLITTSLLSRGLDFSPDVRHVFIVDSPRNMIDFLHRAGRSGRAGQPGKVVVFGKLRGRGSRVDMVVKDKVRALVRR